MPEGTNTVHWGRRRFIEPFLRHLVKKYSKNVEFLVGTVTKTNPDPNDKSKIGTVSYKLKDDDKVHEEPTILFVGMFSSLDLFHDHLLTFHKTALGQCTTVSNGSQKPVTGPLQKTPHRANAPSRTLQSPITPGCATRRRTGPSPPPKLPNSKTSSRAATPRHAPFSSTSPTQRAAMGAAGWGSGTQGAIW